MRAPVKDSKNDQQWRHSTSIVKWQAATTHQWKGNKWQEQHRHSRSRKSEIFSNNFHAFNLCWRNLRILVRRTFYGSKIYKLIQMVSLTWGVLQERITTTNYGTETEREVFKYPVAMNTVQSIFAAFLGYLYVVFTRKASDELLVFPSIRIFWPLCLVALTSAMSSPFGYASLQHVDYITFILAKSCKLLPVMFLHITLYGKRYPFYKYAVVALVTTGVAVFTIYQPGASKKKGAQTNSLYGLMLLGINLLFDGLTNSTQDDIYARFRPYSGQQMMCALNLLSTVLTTGYLLLSPFLVQLGIGLSFGLDVRSAGELQQALSFIRRHPAVGWDILGFATCGAMGQVFICTPSNP